MIKADAKRGKCIEREAEENTAEFVRLTVGLHRAWFCVPFY